MDYTSQCFEAASSATLSGSIEVMQGDWVVATVSARSEMTFPSDWTLLHASAALNSDQSNQRMAMLCKKAESSGSVSFSFQQASATRLYLNLIAMSGVDEIVYHEGSETIGNTKVSSYTVSRPTQPALLWGCSGVWWLSKTWTCADLGEAIGLASNARQANFFDLFPADQRTFTPNGDTGAVIFCVELKLAYNTQCYETSSGTTLTGKIYAQAGDWILATVSGRSAMTYPDDWSLLHESTALSSTNSSQHMAMLCRKVDTAGIVSFSITQASSARLYINLVALSNIQGFKYCRDSEKLFDTAQTSFTVARPASAAIIWGCTANVWASSAPYPRWQCAELGRAISLPSTTQARQANFIDRTSAQSRTFIPGTSSSPAIFFCVEIRDAIEKFLVRCQNTLYTAQDENLQQIDASELTASVFETYGSDDIPSSEALISVQDPEVLRWRDSQVNPGLVATVTGAPPTQELTSEMDMSDESITGIEAFSAEYTGDIQVQYSTDNTYTDSLSMDDFMALDLTVLWEQLQTTKVLKLRFYLPTDASLTSFKISYKN